MLQRAAIIIIMKSKTRVYLRMLEIHQKRRAEQPVAFATNIVTELCITHDVL